MRNEDDQEPARSLAEIIGGLDCFEEQLFRKLQVAKQSARDIIRDEQARPFRRNGKGDARKYALGSALVLLSMDDFDEAALIGLFADPDNFITLLLRAEPFGGTLSQMISWIFADPERFESCRALGLRLQWSSLARLYHREVIDFLGSGKAAMNEQWRRREITVGQQALMGRLERMAGYCAPSGMNRGEAHDWILSKGGDPKFWFSLECVRNEQRDW